MTDPENPAVHAGRLLAGVSAHVDLHLREIENDLRQTSTLLAEAVGNLTSSFLAVHASIVAQQRSLHEGCADGKASGEAIGSQINAIVVGMQFQDMTEQLIDRMVRRVHGVRTVMEALESESRGLAVHAPPGSAVDAIDRLEALFREQNAALDNSLRRAVTQTRMDSGDVELF